MSTPESIRIQIKELDVRRFGSDFNSDGDSSLTKIDIQNAMDSLSSNFRLDHLLKNLEEERLIRIIQNTEGNRFGILKVCKTLLRYQNFVKYCDAFCLLRINNELNARRFLIKRVNILEEKVLNYTQKHSPIEICRSDVKAAKVFVSRRLKG